MGRKVYMKENTNLKKGRVVMLILGKAYFRTSNITTEKQGHFYNNRRINSPGGHKNLKYIIPNNKYASKCLKQTLTILKREADKSYSCRFQCSSPNKLWSK